MKRALPLPGSFLLILTAVTCTMGALISGFVFSVNTGALALTWLIAAFALPAFAAFRRGKGVLLLIPPALALLIWQLPGIVEGAKGVINYISSEYNKWLYIPVFFQDAGASVDEYTVFFAAAGVALACLLYVSICLWRNSYMVVLLTAPLIFLTFILIFHQPSPWFLVGLLAVYLTLIINNAIYPDDKSKKSRGIIASVSLSALLLGAAFFAVSPENYKRGSTINTLDVVIRDIADQAGLARIKYGTGWPALSADGVWKFNTEQVGVADAGTCNISDNRVLDVVADKAGTYYLRGYSMQHFDGRAWSVNSETLWLPGEELSVTKPAFIAAEYSRLFPDAAPAYVNMSISWTNGVSAGVTLAPYNSFPVNWPGDGYKYYVYQTEDSILRLAFEISMYGIINSEQLRFDSVMRTADLSRYNVAVHSSETYTQIDSYTARGLRRLAAEAEIYPGDDRAGIADRVAEYISSSGRYTLSPYIVPEGEDFALYFLENSKQGYCIHFATTAVLMLRALDVPARLTSGFIVTVADNAVGRTVAVTDRNAHAWVEVYFDDIGWLPLEVTPPAPRNEVAEGFVYADTYRSDGPVFEQEDDMPPDWMMEQLMGDRPRVTGGDGDLAQEQPGPSVLRVVIPAVIILVAAIAALLLRRRIAIERRGRRFSQTDTNAAVICVWRYVSRLSRRARSPEALETLALRARFSQHRISEDERADMVGYARKMTGEIYENRSLFGRMWLKWGLAAL